MDHLLNSSTVSLDDTNCDEHFEHNDYADKVRKERENNLKIFNSLFGDEKKVSSLGPVSTDLISTAEKIKRRRSTSDRDASYRGHRRSSLLLPPRKSLRLMTGGEKKSYFEGIDEEDNERKLKSPKPVEKSVLKFRTRNFIPKMLNVDVLAPSEVTEEMIANVTTSCKKVYCQTNGTSCHQCRQKTLDTKTICRSGRCVGVRGAFCGYCLKNRYGEDAAVVLKTENWVCPPCRGECNCSICRTRNGKLPTGQMFRFIKTMGFDSVKQYLSNEADQDSGFDDIVAYPYSNNCDGSDALDQLDSTSSINNNFTKKKCDEVDSKVLKYFSFLQKHHTQGILSSHSKLATQDRKHDISLKSLEDHRSSQLKLCIDDNNSDCEDEFLGFNMLKSSDKKQIYKKMLIERIINLEMIISEMKMKLKNKQTVLDCLDDDTKFLGFDKSDNDDLQKCKEKLINQIVVCVGYIINRQSMLPYKLSPFTKLSDEGDFLGFSPSEIKNKFE